MGKQTTTSRSSPRLDALVNFFLFFFFPFFLFRKEVRMNLNTSIFSVLCLVSLVAGISATGYKREKDFDGEEKDEANREADLSDPSGHEAHVEEPESTEPRCVEKGKQCDPDNESLKCCEEAPRCVGGLPSVGIIAGGIAYFGTGAHNYHSCQEIPPEPPLFQLRPSLAASIAKFCKES